MSDFQDVNREPASVQAFVASGPLGYAFPLATRTLEKRGE